MPSTPVFLRAGEEYRVASQGSSIDLDAKGELTGIIREDAAPALITARLPKPDAATRRQALQLSIDDALAHGADLHAGAGVCVADLAALVYAAAANLAPV